MIRSRRHLSVAFTAAGLATAGLVLSGCSGSTTPTSSAGANKINVTLTDDNGGTCTLDHDNAPAGPVTFTVANASATGITEVELLSDNRIVGEKENLAPGLAPVSFTVTLDGGSYQVYCPGAKNSTLPFTVTGTASTPTGSTAALLNEGTTGYATYVNGVVDAMVVAVGKLNDAIQKGDLAAAKTAYPEARPFYERIESDVDGFVLPGHAATDNAGSLDYLIDMRASNLDETVGWHGFHAIERDLFGNSQITDTTKKLSTELVQNVATLDSLTKTLSYKPEDLANGAADLLEEVQSTKITGEEEAFSHYDLVDFAGNVEGAQQAFAFLKPGLEKIDPALTKQVSDQFATVISLLDGYRDASTPGGYKLWVDPLKSTDAPTLSRAVQNLQEPLSQIAEKVATAQ